jgi:hypothetical protein
MEVLTEQVRLDFHITFEVVNPTHRREKFHQHIAFEKAENATLHELTLISSADHYTIKDGLKENPKEPGIMEAKGRSVRIRPSKSNIRYLFGAKYSMILPIDFYYKHHFGSPTINATISIDAPKELNVRATSSEIHNGMSWAYQKLFMPEDALHICWNRSAK